MKKLTTLSALLLLLSLASTAQISIEHDYPASATLTQLSLSGYKYYLMDVANDECRVYNLDHSLWKTIPLDIPEGMTLYDVRYVSETLFNPDSKVELAYVYYKYDTTLYYYTYYTSIIDENGTELLSIPGCAYLEVKPAGNDGYKLFAYVYDYSIINWTVNTEIYSLPGTLPSAVQEMAKGGKSRPPFPNPADTRITVPYSIPDGLDNAYLKLVDGAGQTVRSYRLDPASHELSIMVTGFPAGEYFYTLECEKGILDNGKLIVN